MIVHVKVSLGHILPPLLADSLEYKTIDYLESRQNLQDDVLIKFF